MAEIIVKYGQCSYMAISLAKRVISYLKENSDHRYTARQIAEWFFQQYSAECAYKKERSHFTTDEQLIQQLVAEISAQLPRSQKSLNQIKLTEGRPRKYYYTEKTEQAEAESSEDSTTILGKTEDRNLKEHDLYKLLSEYLWSEFCIYSKRIDEKRSHNSKGLNGNKWLYPDVVGMEDLSSGWHQEIKDCVSQYADKKTKLWSFEVKLHINRANVREVYFQAVSNSSWANFGYLVAAEIEGADTLKELRILFAVHGIGIIRLNVDNLAESEVLIPARERLDIDWGTCNRLATENKDFLQFIKLVRQFYQTGEPIRSIWDI